MMDTREKWRGVLFKVKANLLFAKAFEHLRWQWMRTAVTPVVGSLLSSPALKVLFACHFLCQQLTSRGTDNVIGHSLNVHGVLQTC